MVKLGHATIKNEIGDVSFLTSILAISTK